MERDSGKGGRIPGLGIGDTLRHARNGIDNIADGFNQQAFICRPLLIAPSQPCTECGTYRATCECSYRPDHYSQLS